MNKQDKIIALTKQMQEVLNKEYDAEVKITALKMLYVMEETLMQSAQSQKIMRDMMGNMKLDG